MRLLPQLFLASRERERPEDRLGENQPYGRSRSRLASRSRARTTVVAFALAAVGMSVGMTVGMDRVFPVVRDPEYGKKLARLRARAAESPTRPVVVVLGSSRVALGVRPAVANDSPDGPLVFNFATMGSGPVMTVMTLRRLLADGLVPDAMVLEFWPAFLRGDGQHAEEIRIDKHRLRPEDGPFIDDYFDTADHTRAIMRQIRQVPWSSHRRRLVAQVAPGWVPWDQRIDAAWQKMDPWGWMPGLETDPPADERAERHRIAYGYYRQVFDGYHISPLADRATRELLTTCRDRGVPVAYLWLPESSEFAGWVTPEAACLGEEYLSAIRSEFGVPLIDARGWLPDEQLPDGFHPTQPGATKLSRRLGPAVRNVFAGLARRGK